MRTKNFHADWGDGSYATVEERAKQVNFVLDQLENGNYELVSDEELSDIDNKPRRSFFGLGFWTILIVGGLSIIGGWVATGSNLLLQPARVIQQTFDADNMIYNYEWFRQQYQDIDAMRVRIINSQAQLEAWLANAPERSTWKIQDSQTYSQLNSIVLGQRNQLAQMISNYNSRATMANRSIFMAGLPSQIPN